MKQITPLIFSLALVGANAHAAVTTVNTGWNLVASCGSSFTEILNGNSANIEQVQNQAGDFYIVSAQGGTLSSMESGKGYWLKADQQLDVDPGELSSDATVSLTSGWSLVGVCSDTDFTSFLGTNTSTEIEQIQNQAGDFYIVSAQGGTLSGLEKGKAYWVKALQDTNIVVEADFTSSLNTDGWYQEVVTTTSAKATQTATVSLPVGSYTIYADLTVDSATGLVPEMSVTDANSNSISVSDTGGALKQASLTVTEAGEYTISVSSSSGVNGEIWVGAIKSDATYDKSGTISTASGAVTDYMFEVGEAHTWTVDITETGNYTLTATMADSGNGLEAFDFSTVDSRLKNISYAGSLSTDYRRITFDVDTVGSYTAVVKALETQPLIGAYTLELTKN